MKTHIAFEPYYFVKSETGNLYMCPADIKAKAPELTDEELRELCVSDDERPYND